MRSLRQLRIFEDDYDKTPQSNPKSGRHRVSINVSNLSTRYDCSKIIFLSPCSHFDAQSRSSSDISDQPLNELLFFPSPTPSEPICDNDNSLFKILMTESKSPEPLSRLNDSCDRTMIQIDFLRNNRHQVGEPNSSLKLFSDNPGKRHHSEFQKVADKLFGSDEQSASQNHQPRARTRQPRKCTSGCSSDIIDLRGISKLVQNLKSSIKSLEKENSDLRLKCIDHAIEELRK